MKKLISAFLSIVLVVVMIPAMGVSAVTEGYYTYTVTNDEATITKVDTSIEGNITIPNTLGGYPVTGIINYAFSNCSKITSITIPSNVINIISRSFYNCPNIASINVSEDNIAYKTINGVLFTKDGKTLIKYPTGNAATLYTIPAGVTIIDHGAFRECSTLTDVVISDSVTSIGNGAFYSCKKLINVAISNNVTSIGESAFGSCEKITNIIIPNSIMNIGNHAFSHCYSLENVTIGGNITSIGNSTFFDCRKLTSVTIPDSVTNIGDSAFNYCYTLIDVFYTGTRSKWNNIKTGLSNTRLTDAKYIHFNVSNPESHNIVVTTEPTCLDDGYKDITCTCGYSRRDYITKSGHNIIHHEMKEPTCAEVGWKAYENCSKCDYTTYNELPATGLHTGGVPTCTNKAICDICHNEYGDTDPASHDPIHHEGKAPTCTETGWDAYETCSRCDYTTYNELPSNGHSPVYHSAKSPTCTEGGWEAYETCENCDYTTYVEIRKHGHQYELNVCIHCGEREPIPYGDASGDGKINLADVSLMLKYIAKWNVELDTDAADVTCDGKVNLADVSLILKYIAKWDVVLGK